MYKEYKATKNLKLLDEFIFGDEWVVEIPCDRYASYKSAVTSINSSIKRFNYKGLRAFTKFNRVFLIKT